MDHSDTLPPDGIPQDVWEAANTAITTTRTNRGDGIAAQFRQIMAQAILAERERCRAAIECYPVIEALRAIDAGDALAAIRGEAA